MNEDVLISVNNVSKKFCRNLRSSLFYGIKDIAGELFKKPDGKLRENEFWALKDISFEFKRGEALAIIGSNGSGKSTLLKLLYGLIRPDAGQIRVKGKMNAIIELQTGLDPLLTGHENIYNKATLFGLNKRQIEHIIDEIVDFSGIEEFINSPVGFYSSGMKSRLGYSIAAFLKPDILLIDEVLAVGDHSFQRKCLNHLLEFTSQGNSLILVSHEPMQTQTACRSAILLDKGQIIYRGNPTDTLHFYFQQTQRQELDNSPATKLPLSEENPLSIDDISIESVTGEEIKTGSDVEVKIFYRSLKTIERSNWFFGIWTDDDLTCVAGSVMIPAVFEAGEGETACLVPGFNLAAGKYLLKALAGFDEDFLCPIAAFGLQNPPKNFEVNSTSDKLAIIQSQQKQLTVMYVKK